MENIELQREKLLKLNLECLDAYEKLPYAKRVEIEYDEFHADFLASRGVILQSTAHWILKDNKGNGTCSHCNRQDSIDPLATHCRYCGALITPQVKCRE